MTELDDLIATLRAELDGASAGSGDAGTMPGMLAGLLATGQARLVPVSGESVYHHAGYLSGHVLRWLSERGLVLDDHLRLTAAGYAASIADPGGQAMLNKPDRPMTAHSYAAIRCEQTTGQALPESDERMLFGWLLEQTATPHTLPLGATFDRLRTRRHARLALQQAQPGPAPAPPRSELLGDLDLD